MSTITCAQCSEQCERTGQSQKYCAPCGAIRDKYNDHKHRAARRGIPFLLSFEEWWSIWDGSGQWNNRGNRRGMYAMARFKDLGGYEVSNVRIITSEENNAERETTATSRAKVSVAVRGENNSSAKLTGQQVLEIRISLLSLRKLAAIYNVSHTTIRAIKQRRTWSWLPDGEPMSIAPSPTTQPQHPSDQRVIRRLADLGDWLDRERVIDALGEDGAARSPMRCRHDRRRPIQPPTPSSNWSRPND
jgi:hypothetical protein